MNLYKVTFRWFDASTGTTFVVCDSINNIESTLLNNNFRYEVVSGTELIAENVYLQKQYDE
jgi:hypothetical protein